jgi:hypothetical protein
MWTLVVACRGAGERAARALEVLVDGAGCTLGYLYLVQGAVLELAAPAFGEEQQDGFVSGLRDAVFPAGLVEGRGDAPWQPAGVSGEASWERALLVVQQDGVQRTVGVVAVIGPRSVVRAPSAELVEHVARELYAAGDVTVGSGSRST